MRIKQKLLATKEIWFSQKNFRIVELAEETHIRATVRNILNQRFLPQSTQHSVVIEGAIDEIVEKVKASPSKSVTSQLEDILKIGEPLNQAFWFHSQLAGLTAAWEFKIRFLGAKLGVSPNAPCKKNPKKIELKILSNIFPCQKPFGRYIN